MESTAIRGTAHRERGHSSDVQHHSIDHEARVMHPIYNGRVAEKRMDGLKSKQRKTHEAGDDRYGPDDEKLPTRIQSDVGSRERQGHTTVNEAEEALAGPQTGISPLLVMAKEGAISGKESFRKNTLDRYSHRVGPVAEETPHHVESYLSRGNYGSENASRCQEENSEGRFIHLVEQGCGVGTLRVSAPLARVQDNSVPMIEDGHIIVYKQGPSLQALENEAGAYSGIIVPKVEPEEAGESVYSSSRSTATGGNVPDVQEPNKTHASVRVYVPCVDASSHRDNHCSTGGTCGAAVSQPSQPGLYSTNSTNSQASAQAHSFVGRENDPRSTVTYAESSVVRPQLHECPRSAPLVNSNCSGRNNNSDDGSVEGNRRTSAPSFHADGRNYSQQPESLGKSWPFSSDREGQVGQHHCVSESVGCSYPGTPGSSSTAAMGTSHQVYEDYLSGTPAIANAHPNYTELSGAYPGYGSPYSSWPAACHTSTVHADNCHSYPQEPALPEGEQKAVMGYPPVHAQSMPASYTAHYPTPYLPPPSATYIGYAGDCNWHNTGKNVAAAGERIDASGGRHTARDAAMYHHQHQPYQQQQQQQQQQLQSGIMPKHVNAPVPAGRGWDSSCTSPGWDTTTQRNARYTPSARGRGVRVDPGAQVKQSYNGGSCNTRSAPVAASNNFVCRPRKRTASLPEATAEDKASYQAGSAASLPAKEPPARKRARDAPYPVTSNVHTLRARDAPYPVTSNVHTLKPSHIIAWYIDYLIHENEDRTQISRAFTLPVNLFHTDDFYFLESLRKKVRFPSPKFLAWMQRQLPSINAHAIDFREGRPVATGNAGGWNADWNWQSRSKHDIIHDVFFFFQHRKAANPDRETILAPRAKGPQVA